MKILVINPVSISMWDELTRKVISEHANASTFFDVIHIDEAPKSIESFTDVAQAAPFVVHAVIKAEKQGYDAAIINCFDDPGLQAAREQVSIPVYGIGETSMVLATLFGHKFAVISTGKNSRAVYERKALKLGLSQRIAYSIGIDVGVLDLRSNEAAVKQMILDEAKRAIEVYGAEVIVLGCGGMTGFAEELEHKIHVPVIDPMIATFKIVEALTPLGLKQSKAFLYSFKR
ncbi:MAG: aspartate/glutamate racemase family protein [Candidatus Bathyarchaeia archaeon]